MRLRPKLVAITLLTVVGGGLVLSACSGSSAGTGAEGGLNAAQAQGMPGRASSGVGASRAANGNAGNGTAGGSGGASLLGQSVPASQQLVIRSGYMTIAVVRAHVQMAFNKVSNDAIQLGGYVASSRTGSTAASDGSASLVVKVPTQDFATLATEVSGLGKVTGVSLGGNNVTGQSINLVARITNLKSEESALRALMARAGTIPDVLQVQNELFTVESDIEQLSSQESSLISRATFGSLSVTISPKPKGAHHKKTAPSGLVGRVGHLAAASTVASVRAIGVAVGWAFPAIVIAAIVTLGWWLRRRLHPGTAHAGEGAGSA